MCFFKLIKVHLLASELYIYQNAWCNNKKKLLEPSFTLSPFHNQRELKCSYKEEYLSSQPLC